jgi:predicted ATP-grasp superfamily ATP-dependent carboligase
LEKDEVEIPACSELVKPVLVLQGSYLVELAIARSLGRYNIPVFLLSRDQKKPPSSFSKFVKDTIFNPDPLIDKDAFIRSLLGFGEKLKEKYQRRILLFPTDDGTLLLLARNFDLFKKYFVILNDPQEKEILRFSQKIYFFQTLQKTSCANFLPLTLFCEREEDIESIKKNITFPCIIKPSEKDINFSFHKKYNSKILVVENKDDLEKELTGLLSEKHKLVVQELVNPKPGKEVSWYGYRSKSGEIFGMTARQKRKSPQMGGTATFIEKKEIPQVHPYVHQALKSLSFWGICEMEFMLDERKKEYKIVEFNPRCWLQLSLATEAGLNLPYLTYQEVYKNVLPKPIIDKKRRIKWVWVKEDFLSAIIKDRNEAFLKRLFKWLPQVLGDCVYAIHSFSDLGVTFQRILGGPERLLKKFGFSLHLWRD